MLRKQVFLRFFHRPVAILAAGTLSAQLVSPRKSAAAARVGNKRADNA